MRNWIFRIMIVIIAALIVFSWQAPWWTVDLTGEMPQSDVVMVYPYALEANLGEYVDYIAGSDMPGWFAPFMWTYLVIVILSLLVSLFIKDKNFKLWKIKGTIPSWITGIVGFSYIVIVIAAVVTITLRSADFYDMKLLEPVMLMDHPEIWATGHLEFNYWLSCALGPILILLALFRNKIIGNN